MTTEEKRNAIKEKCSKSSYNCIVCPLANFKEQYCYSEPLPDEKVDRNYKVMFPETKTRQEILIEDFPNVKLLDDIGVVDICPHGIDKNLLSTMPCKVSCTECLKEYWLTPV